MTKIAYFFAALMAVCSFGLVNAQSEQDPDPKYLIIQGDPEAYTVTQAGTEILPDAAGNITVVSIDYEQIVIKGNDGYLLDRVTYNYLGDIQEIYVDKAANTCTLWSSSYQPGETVFTVESRFVGTERTFTASIVGDPEAVMIRNSNSGEMLWLLEEPIEIPIVGNPTYDIMAASGRAIYQLEVNGEPLPWITENYWSYSPENGDVLVIRAEFPDMQAPVNFTFSDAAQRDIISEVWLGATQVADWANGLNVPLGTNVQLFFNTMGYKNVEVTLNGEVMNMNYCRFTVRDPQGYTFNVTADQGEVYTVNVTTNIPGSFNLLKGWTNDAYAFDPEAENFTLFVSPEECAVNIRPLTGYLLEGITVDGVESGNPVYVTADCSINIEMQAIERPKKALVWVDPTHSWTYCAVILSQNNYDLRTEYQFPETLPHGYSEISFADFDLPLNLGFYPDAAAYLNDTKLQQKYGIWEGLDAFKEGDIIKIAAPRIEEAFVTYMIDGEGVTVTHDRIQEVANPGTHMMLPGNELSIRVPEGAEAEVAVDGTPLAADEEGVFTHVVTGDHVVSVKVAESAVKTIGAENGAEEIFNLQGIRVSGNRAELPAGVYILNGKKIVVK